MANYQTGINDSPLNLCSLVLETIFFFQDNGKIINREILLQQIGKTKQYVEKAIGLLELVGCISVTNEVVSIEKQIFNHLATNLGEFNSLTISKLVQLPPFVTYCNFLKKGKTSADSAKLVCAIYDIDRPSQTIQSVFTKWLKLANIEIGKNISTPSGFDIDKQQRDALEARVFCNEILGNNFVKVNSRSIDDFVEGILEYNTDPKKAINDIGRGFEDFLRLDFATNVNLKKSSGIGQIGNELQNKELIHPKHNHLISAISSLRSMGDAHGVDKNTNERWELETNTTFSSILLVLNTINSLFAYKEHNLLKL